MEERLLEQGVVMSLASQRWIESKSGWPKSVSIWMSTRPTTKCKLQHIQTKLDLSLFSRQPAQLQFRCHSVTNDHFGHLVAIITFIGTIEEKPPSSPTFLANPLHVYQVQLTPIFHDVGDYLWEHGRRNGLPKMEFPKFDGFVILTLQCIEF